MKKIVLTIIIASLHLLSFAQQSKRDKNKTVSETLFGSWKFDYALYHINYMGTEIKEKSKVFGVDTLSFFKNMTFKFRNYNANDQGVRTNLRTANGTWEYLIRAKH